MKKVIIFADQTEFDVKFLVKTLEREGHEVIIHDPRAKRPADLVKYFEPDSIIASIFDWKFPRTKEEQGKEIFSGIQLGELLQIEDKEKTGKTPFIILYKEALPEFTIETLSRTPWSFHFFHLLDSPINENSVFSLLLNEQAIAA